MSIQTVRHRDAVGGLGYIVLAAVALALADGLVKILSSEISVWQLMVLRALVALPILAVVAARRGAGRLWPKRPGWVALRSLLLVAMWVLVYVALTGLPLPSVSAALYCSPLLITLFCALMPGRGLSRGEAGAVVLGFVGVLVLLRPGTQAFSPMLWLPLAGAALYALAALLTATHCRDESPLALAAGVQLAFLIAGGLALTGFFLVATPTGWHEAAPFVADAWQPVAGDALPKVAAFIGALAVIAVVASAAMARAYQIAPAPLVAAGDYSYLVFSALWSVLLFDHLPDIWAWTGITLIVIAGLLATRGSGQDGGDRQCGPFVDTRSPSRDRGRAPLQRRLAISDD